MNGNVTVGLVRAVFLPASATALVLFAPVLWIPASMVLGYVVSLACAISWVAWSSIVLNSPPTLLKRWLK